MSDTFSREKRTQIMSSIHSTKTSLENLVSSYLWKKGLRFRRNDKTLYGKPDISVKKYRLVIFIDSCFWHGCPDHCRMPHSNTDYWKRKISRNSQRDVQVTLYYEQRDWRILRVWEHDLVKDLLHTLERIETFFLKAKQESQSILE